MDCNEVFMKDVIYDNIKSHKRPGFHRLFRRYIFQKTRRRGGGGGSNWPSLLPAHFSISPFVPKVPFLYPLKTSENTMVFLCFQGVEKGCIGNEWVNVVHVHHVMIDSPTRNIFIV